MGSNCSLFFLSCLLVLCYCRVNGDSNIFDLVKYGGASRKNFDNKKALTKAWNDACKWKGKGEAIVSIPQGNYYLSPIQLKGPCSNPIKFQNFGILRAPSGSTNLGYWITFSYIDKLSIKGGFYNGRGETAWDKHGSINPTHSLLSLSFVNNSRVDKMHLINSKKVHLTIFASNNVDVKQLTILAPEKSPNTDGIKLALSTNVNIYKSIIFSGDDCVAILTGTSNVNVTEVWCGPGHGFSIGSIGGVANEFVSGIRFHNCTLSKTQNGVRIKTKPTNNPGWVTNVRFEDIIMDNAHNPIIIDQIYCPHNQCEKGVSKVQISEVKFNNIKGTSASEVAVNLQCSKSNPCQKIRLNNVDLSYNALSGHAKSNCSNAKGQSTGVQHPVPCLS